MRRHNGLNFSTFDADHDRYAIGNCAWSYKGGWWWQACLFAHLNGLYLGGSHTDILGAGIIWSTWRGNHYSLKFSEMKMRPVT